MSRRNSLPLQVGQEWAGVDPGGGGGVELSKANSPAAETDPSADSVGKAPLLL